MPKVTERMIRAMTYDSRIVRYNQEKNDLYKNNPGKPAAWLEEKRMELQRKWRV